MNDSRLRLQIKPLQFFSCENFFQYIVRKHCIPLLMPTFLHKKRRANRQLPVRFPSHYGIKKERRSVQNISLCYLSCYLVDFTEKLEAVQNLLSSVKSRVLSTFSRQQISSEEGI
nr:MAG TPA: hypothetical protein [Caudoviricetes sp.]